MPILGCLIISICCLAVSASEEACLKESKGAGCDASEAGSSNRYSIDANQDWSKYKQLIQDAVREYIPCDSTNCSCYTSLIDQDLSTFEDGVYKDMVNRAKEKGVLYQIVDKKLYRQDECMFQFRCSGVEHFLLEIIQDLPDMEFVLNTRDWPQSPRYGREPLPVFSFSKTPDYYDITYPAWTFWEGGPAISLYPRGLGRWDQHRESLKKASARWPWEEKKNVAFFRGSRTSDERDPLVLLSREKPDLVDAQYTKNQAWRSEKDTLGAAPAAEMSLEDHCQYKYLFNYRGVAASFRFKHLFLCKSLVFHVGEEWTEFFYPEMKPWVHYIPVDQKATQEGLREIIAFAKANDDLAKEIAVKGAAFIEEHLKMSDVSCYWKELLVRYSHLLKYQVILDKTLIRIE